MTPTSLSSDAPDRPATRAGAVESGFTLIELLVSLVVMTAVILAALGLFQMNNKVARVQTQLAELQQYQRVAHQELGRLIRMAGRGGLAVTRALGVRNNVPAGETILLNGGPEVVPETDVITVRGVFESEIYVVEPGSYTYDSANGQGFITLRSFTSDTGVPQDVDYIQREILAEGIPDALLLVSSLDDSIYSVVEIDPDYEDVTTDNSTDPPATVLRLRFNAKNTPRSPGYQSLHPGGINVLDSGQIGQVAFAGIVEEYRFYVRDVDAQGNLANVTASAPRLSMARVYPGTEIAYNDAPANLSLDLADNVLDLQAALGFDTDADGTVEEGESASDRQSDEWRFNEPGDTAPLGNLAVVRVTTLVRTDRPDERYRAPRVADIEDHVLAGHVYNTSSGERLFRRRTLRTVVDLRNL